MSGSSCTYKIDPTKQKERRKGGIKRANCQNLTAILSARFLFIPKMNLMAPRCDQHHQAAAAAVRDTTTTRCSRRKPLSYCVTRCGANVVCRKKKQQVFPTLKVKPETLYFLSTSSLQLNLLLSGGGRADWADYGMEPGRVALPLCTALICSAPERIETRHYMF